jgi:HEAT repeat protein
MLRFACPHCKVVLTLPPAQAGQLIICPQCKQQMKAPNPSRVLPPDAVTPNTNPSKAIVPNEPPKPTTAVKAPNTPVAPPGQSQAPLPTTKVKTAPKAPSSASSPADTKKGKKLLVVGGLVAFVLIGGLIVLGGAAAAAWYFWRPAATSPQAIADKGQDDVGDNTVNKAILAKLNKPISVDAIEPNTPLKEALGFLSEGHGITIVLDTDSFPREVGNPGDLPIRLPKISNVPLGEVLKLLLQQVDATYLVRAGHVQVVSNSGRKKEAVAQTDDPEPKRGPAEPEPTPPAPSVAMTAEQVYKRLLKSTAWILAADERSSGWGSGSLVHRDQRLILTNYHVVGENEGVGIAVFFPSYRGAGSQLVTEPAFYLENARQIGLRGKVVSRDRAHDLALVQLEKLPAGVRQVNLAPKSAGPGQDVHSIGASGVRLDSPDSIGGTLWRYSSGKVRQVYQDKKRYGEDWWVNSYFVETDSPTNSGDSGGPVVNDRGQLVAVVSSCRVQERLVSSFIDVREARSLLRRHFQDAGLKWEETTDPIGDGNLDLRSLVKQLSNPNVDSRLKAVQQLAEMGLEARTAVPALMPLLKDKDDQVRKATAAALDLIGLPAKEDVPALLAALRDEHPDVRTYAARTLARPEIVLGAQALPALSGSLGDSNPAIRKNVVAALGNLGPENKEAVLPLLLAALRDEDKSVARTVQETLIGLGGPAPSEIPVYVKALKDSHADVRSFASAALATLGIACRDVKPDLVAALKDKDPRVRANAVVALGNLGRDARLALPEMVAVLQDPEATVRRQAINALARMGKSPVVVKGIVGALQDSDAEVCRAACAYLLKTDALTAEDIGQIRGALKSEQPIVRGFAARSLAKLGTEAKEAVPDLIRAARDKDLAVRLESVRALGLIGADAKAVVPVLAEILAAKVTEDTDDSPPDMPTGKAGDPSALYSRVLRSSVFVASANGQSASGWLVDRSGKRVITSASVAREQTEVVVFFPSTQFNQLVTTPRGYVRFQRGRLYTAPGMGITAKVISTDPRRNLALVELASLPEGVQQLPLSRQNPTAGQKIHSVGAFGVNMYAGNGALWQYGRGEVRTAITLQPNGGEEGEPIAVVEASFATDFGDRGCPVVNDRGELLAMLATPSTRNLNAYIGVDVREVRRFLVKTLGKEWTDKRPQSEDAAEMASNVSQRDVRKAAATALGKMGAEATPSLVKLLNGKDAGLRSVACEALGEIGTGAKAAVPDLILTFKDDAVREQAVEALAKIGTPAVQPLIDQLTNRTPAVRIGAAQALGKLGPKAKAAIPVLARLRNHPVPEVRQAIRDAMDAIQR